MNNVHHVTKKDGRIQEVDITKIHKVTEPATAGLDGVSQSDLEVSIKLKFKDKIPTSEIESAIIDAAVEKIDIDTPNYTFTAARLKLYQIYHKVGRVTGGVKGNSYAPLKKHVETLQEMNRYVKNLANGFDLEDLNNYIEPERDLLFNYLGLKTLEDRYLIKDKNGDTVELPQHFFMCIAMFLASKEHDSVKQKRAKEFYDVISKLEVMLATPTLSNGRTMRHQLSSCYIGSTPDNIEGIFDSYHEMALLSKYGGGIGWDWNNVRALGGSIDDHKSAAGGTVPFLKIANDVAIAVDQLGTRKGAIAVYVEPWHMDINDFIDLKKNSGEERRRAHDLFPSLWISDLFMQRILDDGYWTLFDPHETPDLGGVYGEEFANRYMAYEIDPTVSKDRVKAKDLWKKILTSYFESGSPFLCFKDRANEANPNSHTGHIRSSNLCTEIFQNTSPNHYNIKIEFEDGSYVSVPEGELINVIDKGLVPAKHVTSLDTLSKSSALTNDGIALYDLSDDQRKVYCIGKDKTDGKTAVCNLASVNMAKVKTKEDIERVVPITVRMLDNIIDLNYYPLRKVKDTNMGTRSIGMGVMGIAELMAVSGIHWGTPEHISLITRYMEVFSYETIKASSDLALEKGSYREFEGSKWSEGYMPFDSAPKALYDLLESENIEPLNLDWDYLRAKVKRDGMRNGYLMAIAPTSSISILVGTTQALEPVYKRKWFEDNLSGLIPVTAPKLNPDTWTFYTPAYEVDQKDIIVQSAIVCMFIDQGHSCNIFINPEKASGGYLNGLYMFGWKLGLKSFYYLRSLSPEANNDVEDRSMECSGCQ